MPTWVVVSVYLVRVLHFSPLQLVLMGTAMEAAVFLSEIPTGVVADTYSRRLSLIIGYLGMGTAWMLVGVFSATSMSQSSERTSCPGILLPIFSTRSVNVVTSHGRLRVIIGVRSVARRSA